jgi:hypothetical protein
MSLLYKFSLEDNYEQLKEYLIQSLPTTLSLVGWLVGTGFYESDPQGKCKILTSHPDPIQCKDPVVWFFDSDHRVRIHMSTENILDQGENTPEAIALADSAVYKGKTIPTYFIDPELEKLYIKSKEILVPIVKEFVYKYKKDAKSG